jgi:hypothetical protein
VSIPRISTRRCCGSPASTTFLPTALSRLVPDGHPTAEAARRRTVKRHLATYGYAEAVDFSFSDPDGDLGFPMI